MHQISGEPNKAIQMLQVLQSADGYLEEVTIRGHQGVSTDQWLMISYIMVSVILFLSVLLSLRKITSIIRSHTIQWVEKIRFINTNAQGTPFSFFNFIFWNEDIDLQTETGQQIFQHELVHVKEKHTIDKLFVQLILIGFWCNPFFWLVRRELKLIHEFIADKKAVGEHGTAALAAMILGTSYPTQFNSITNQFFQTSIKRRLAMLTKIQNVKINYISRILALPILAFTVLAFTLRTKTVNVSSIKLDKQITVVVDAGHGIMENGKPNGVSVGDISEDNVVLAIANKIKELNSNDNLKIILTRTTDKLIDLHKRVDIAKENKADLFISLHIDAKVENQDPGLSSEKSLSSGFGIYVSNKQTAHQTQSETLGSILGQELNSIYPVNPYLLKRKVGVWVLDQNVCPSVLLECGFLTDNKDREFISKENNQAAIAQKVLTAIERYAANQHTFQKINTDTIPQKLQINSTIKNENPLSNQKGNGLIVKSGVPVQPLYILDGKEVNREEIDKIDPSAIESINVLKGDTATNKYGKKGVNGVIEMFSKSNITVKDVSLKPLLIDTIPQKNSQNKIREIFIDGQKLRPEEVRINKISLDQAKNSKQPIVVDDKLVRSIDDVNPSEIASISIAFGLPIVKDYGDKATLGVIFITTKNYKTTGKVNRNNQNTTSKIPEISLGDLKRMTGINIPDLKSFTIVGELKNGNLYSCQNKGANFDGQAKILWSNLKIGSVLTFENLIAIENNVEVKKPAMIYRVVS